MGVTSDTVWLLPAKALRSRFIVTLFSPNQEYIHDMAFRSYQWNLAVDWMARAPTLIHAFFYRAVYLAHYWHAQFPSRDPKLVTP